MNITPHQLMEQINEISELYFEKCQEAAEIAERKGLVWLEMRKLYKTNAETDQAWDASADGRRENYLKWFIKGLQAKRGALILEHKLNQGSL